MAKKRSNGGAKQDIVKRVRTLYTIFILVGLCVAARLIWVQYFSPSVKHNAEVMKSGVRREQTIAAHRGAILSREGEPLALSSLRYHATFDFASEGIRNASSEDFEKEVGELSQLLADHFSKEDAAKNDYDYLTAQQYRDIFYKQRELGKGRAVKIFPRSVTLDEWNMFKREFPILNQSLGYVYDSEDIDERIYPSGDLARQIIGRNTPIIVEGDTILGSGIELLCNDYLSGHDGTVVEQRIAHGFWTRVNDPKNSLPEDGSNVVTTIDAGLQRMATERLREKLTSEEATYGVAMVMEVETGNILCMVNLSTGKVRGTNYNERTFNHALQTAMTPGSTFKLASAMALAELAGFNADTKVHITGKQMKVGLTNITDSHDLTRELGKEVCLRDAFAHSSNIYFAKGVFDNFGDKPEVYTQYLERIGFCSTVGLDAFGERRGSVPQPGTPELKRHGSIKISLPKMGYGYILEQPAIHMLTFYNGVANGGKMLAPRLVDRIERNGEVVERKPIVTLNERLCSKQTIATLHDCLEAAAVRERSLGRFKNAPTSFGCKTGTAQIWNTFHSEATKDRKVMQKRYLNKDDAYYLGSVITMMPLEKPKYTIMVSIAKQKTDTHPTYFGITLTGDVASDIMEYIYTNDPTMHSTIEPAASPYSPKSIKAGNSADVGYVVERLAPYSKPSTEASAWSSAKLDSGGNAELSALTFEDGVVPNVKGMGLSDALYLLEHSGLSVKHTGYGRVTKQSVEAGTMLDGTINEITLTLE